MAGSRPSRLGHACRTLGLIGVGGFTATGCATEEPFDLTTCGAAEVYRIDGVQLPTTHSQVIALGHDLDGDASADNRLGTIASILAQQFSAELSATATTRLRADVTWYAGVRRCEGGEVVVSLSDGVPGDEVQMIGEEVDGVITAIGAGAAVPLATLFDPLGTEADSGWLLGVRGRIDLVVAADGARADAVVGVALDGAAAFDEVTRGMAPFLDAHDDPETDRHLDADRDGAITLDEVRTSTLIQSYLAPDLTIHGTPALSFGLGFSAAPLW